MKRCPQCEFIYEDDQSYCDMDGARLTRDSHLLLGSDALTIQAESHERPRWRKSFVTLSAPLILLSVLTTVYFVSTQETSSTIPKIATPALIQTSPPHLTTPNSPNTESSLSKPEASTPAETNDTDETDSATTDSEKPETKPVTNRQRDRRNIVSPQPQSSTRSRSSNAKPEDKEDSKVRSALKKTGRFFKKALPL